MKVMDRALGGENMANITNYSFPDVTSLIQCIFQESQLEITLKIYLY